MPTGKFENDAALFQQAAIATVDGDVDQLRALLDEHPGLTAARSTDEFGATLLHFVAANGVPDDMQRTPDRAVEVAQLLLERGAEPDALGTSYGGGPNATALCLLVSSWHPFAKGLQSDLVRVLVRGGAAVDGVEDDGAPLSTALVFGYTGAAEALAALGARVDNLLFAAGLGDRPQVEGWFAPDGSPRAGLRGSYGPVVDVEPSLEPLATVQEALHFAVTHGRVEIAEWLLTRGADVNGASVGHHCELPVCQAIFVQKAGAAAWLVQNGADLDAVDGKRNCAAREMAAKSPNAEIRALVDG